MPICPLVPCGPILTFSPAMKLWGGGGYVADPPTCGQLLTLSPALKHSGPFLVCPPLQSIRDPQTARVV